MPVMCSLPVSACRGVHSFRDVSWLRECPRRVLYPFSPGIGTTHLSRCHRAVLLRFSWGLPTGGRVSYQFMDGGTLWLHLIGPPVSGWWHLVPGRVDQQAREPGRPLMARVGCRRVEDANAVVSFMSEGRVPAGWLAFLSAVWLRGSLGFGSSSLILSFFMPLYLGGFHYFLVCILIIF